MSPLKNLRSDKKKIGIIISILILIIGVIPLLIFTYIPELEISYTIEPISLKSEDNIYISAFKYTPKGKKSNGGIIVSHSFLGSKLNMQPLSIELAKRGFTVVSIDFRGHGASGGNFYRGRVIKDMMAAVNYFDNNVSYVSEIGLVGHSLGAEVAITLSRQQPSKINATVAIGGISEDIKGVSNLLMATGIYDPGFREENLLEMLRKYTGNAYVEVGMSYYGDFQNGNNTKGFLSPFSGHLTEVVDPAIIFQTVKWFEFAFHGEVVGEIFITATFLMISSYIALFGVILLSSILIIYLGNFIFKNKTVYPEKNLLRGLRGITTRKMLLFYTVPVMIFQFIFYLALTNIYSGSATLSTTRITLTLVIGAAIGTFLIYNFILLNRLDKFSYRDLFFKIKKMCSVKPLHSLIFGTLSALLLILSIAAVWQWSVQKILPTIIEIGEILLILIISFPFFLMKEFYFRSVQGQLKTVNKSEEYGAMVILGFVMDNLLILFIILIGRVNLAYLPAYALYLLVWVIFSIIHQVAVSFIYLWSGRNILGSTIFLSIFSAWMLVVFFPSYGFI
ncbi:MAG: alpha/beta hydrolase [Promethearchaeota archaeon]